MKIRRPIPRWWPVTLALVLATACGGTDRPGPPTEPAPADSVLSAEEISGAREAIEPGLSLAQVSWAVAGAAREVFFPSGVLDTSMRDALDISIRDVSGSEIHRGGSDRDADHRGLAGAFGSDHCPVIDPIPTGPGRFEIAVDYGDGCTSSTGITARGALHLVAASSAAGASAVTTFENFAVDGRALEGLLDVAGNRLSWTSVFAGTIGGAAGSTEAHADFDLLINTNATPSDASDDSLEVTGTATIGQGVSAWSFAIVQPLVFGPACRYPVRGILSVRRSLQQDAPATQVDFGTGDCCAAVMSIATRRSEVDLCAAP